MCCHERFVLLFSATVRRVAPILPTWRPQRALGVMGSGREGLSLQPGAGAGLTSVRV